MKTTTAIFTIFILLFSCSIVLARHTQTPKDTWQQEFAAEAQEKGLEEAIKNARAEGKEVAEIVEASIAAGYGDYVIVTSLVNVGTEKAEIVAAAVDTGLNLQLVTVALAGDPDLGNGKVLGAPEPVLDAPKPLITNLGGASPPPGASPSTIR